MLLGKIDRQKKKTDIQTDLISHVLVVADPGFPRQGSANL